MLSSRMHLQRTTGAHVNEDQKHNNRQLVGIVSTLAGAIAWGFSGTCVQYLFSSTALNPLLLTTITDWLAEKERLI